MEATIMQENASTPVVATGEQAKATRKGRVAPQRAHVAPKKGRSGKKASSAKKPPKGHKVAAGARDGSKTAKILDLLRRPDGATTKELLKTTGWQPHSLRGFISGTVGKKMGLVVTSTRGENGERSYAIKG